MADAHHEDHGHDDHGHDDHDDHDTHAVEEEVLRTPLWLPFIGLALLMFGAIGTYMFVVPGTFSASNNADGGAAAADASAAAEPAAR